ncbi:hypothetical protein Xoosp13_56 [Xanthomonas phage Xoo-sp13]|nr:hypothetical protein Xoosp13_56 [Xanthomonas phage Xoo-sp13]
MLLNVEMDNDFNSSVLDGSWPTAVEYLKNSAEKCGYKLVPIDS